jgi:hypothetical protein
VEFAGSVSIPLSDSWLIGVDYGYLFGSFQVPDPYGTGDVTFIAHLPSVLIQYDLAEEGTHHVRLGAGGGYHAGTLKERFGILNTRTTGGGPGFVAAVEANTSLGDNLFAYLAVMLRWEFIGEMTDADGRPVRVSRDGPAATLHSFAPGARLGLTFAL